jgi:hypothetical protein
LASSKGSQGGNRLSPGKKMQRVPEIISKNLIYFPATFHKPKGFMNHSKKKLFDKAWELKTIKAFSHL